MTDLTPDAQWLAWSDGRYPDDSPGDVIAAEPDGTITLDDGITTWNPLRASAFFKAALDAERARALEAETGRVHQREMKLEWKARAERLEAVAEAARDDVARHPGQLKRLRAALRRLDANEDTERIPPCTCHQPFNYEGPGCTCDSPVDSGGSSGLCQEEEQDDGQD